MKSIWFFGLLFLFLSDCKRKEQSIPSAIIPEEKMVEILADLRLAEASYKVLSENGVRTPEYIHKTYESIYKMHRVTAFQMDTSMKYYSMDPEYMEKMLKRVSVKIEEAGKIKP